MFDLHQDFRIPLSYTPAGFDGIVQQVPEQGTDLPVRKRQPRQGRRLQFEGKSLALCRHTLLPQDQVKHRVPGINPGVRPCEILLQPVNISVKAFIVFLSDIFTDQQIMVLCIVHQLPVLLDSRAEFFIFLLFHFLFHEEEIVLPPDIPVLKEQHTRRCRQDDGSQKPEEAVPECGRDCRNAC